ncbi:MAG: PTS sugar transporter subunit IIB [Bacillota bacterium]
MLNLALVRVDDRLIHGQVVAVWMRALSANRIIIVDDKVAKDAFMQDILAMAAPPGVPVEAFTVADAVEVLKGEPAPGEKVIVLMKNPAAAVALRAAGVAITHLNVGGMGAGPGRKSLYRNISASQEEINMLKLLSDQGVEVEFRIVAEEKGVSLANVLAGRK